MYTDKINMQTQLANIDRYIKVSMGIRLVPILLLNLTICYAFETCFRILPIMLIIKSIFSITLISPFSYATYCILQNLTFYLHHQSFLTGSSAAKISTR